MLRRRVSGAWHKDSKVEKGRRMRRPFFSSARAMRVGRWLPEQGDCYAAKPSHLRLFAIDCIAATALHTCAWRCFGGFFGQNRLCSRRLATVVRLRTARGLLRVVTQNAHMVR
jgi:hypothetical protein